MLWLKLSQRRCEWCGEWHKLPAGAQCVAYSEVDDAPPVPDGCSVAAATPSAQRSMYTIVTTTEPPSITFGDDVEGLSAYLDG
eukprot:gene12591-biopygen1806